MKWPEELPKHVQQKHFRGDTSDGAIRQDMDAGPAYQRPRYAAIVETFEISFSFPLDQYKRFREFWFKDLLNGTQKFDWEHPETHEPARVQFDASKGFTREVNGPELQVSMTLEVLPGGD